MIMINYQPHWLPAPANLALPDGEIHVWRIELDRPAAQVEQLAGVLGQDEPDRAGRFHFERDRRRFTVARGALRVILSRYVAFTPGELRFAYGPYGKPALAPPFNRNELQFNVAHSHNLALCAVKGSGSELGVDVEYIRPVLEAEQIAGRYFSPAEQAALRACPPEQKLAAFFNCWTRKEAYLKALGDGLARPLADFDVSLAPGEPVRLLQVKDQPEEAARWFLAAFIPLPGYVAALATAGNRPWAIRYIDFSAV